MLFMDSIAAGNAFISLFSLLILRRCMCSYVSTSVDLHSLHYSFGYVGWNFSRAYISPGNYEACVIA